MPLIDEINEKRRDIRTDGYAMSIDLLHKSGESLLTRV
jgi:hypothetical protein